MTGTRGPSSESPPPLAAAATPAEADADVGAGQGEGAHSDATGPPPPNLVGLGVDLGSRTQLDVDLAERAAQDGVLAASEQPRDARETLLCVFTPCACCQRATGALRPR